MSKPIIAFPDLSSQITIVEGQRYTSIMLAIYCVLLVGSALEAYNLAFIPIQWLTQIGVIITAIHIGFTRCLYKVPGSKAMKWLFYWATAVTFWNLIFNDYSRLMPSNATTPYLVFIFLRLLNILSFIATFHIVYWLLMNGYCNTLIKWAVITGSIIAVAGLYIYIAQIYNLPEPPRNRIGTNGGEQITVFSYAFHRAMGTFREPSHLSAWLTVPFFLSFAYRQSPLNIHTILITTSILLTGSLTGIVGSALGFAGAIIITRPYKLKGIKVLLGLVVVLLVSLGIFYSIAVSRGAEGVNIFKVIGDRMSPILFEGGLKRSNRDYVYEYLANTPIPLVGPGLGNSNLLFSQYLDKDIIVAFISLYVNYLFSLGMIGLALICFFLLSPVTRALKVKELHHNWSFVFILSAYLAWLVMFGVGSEELTFVFASIFALLTYETHCPKLTKEGGEL